MKRLRRLRECTRLKAKMLWSSSYTRGEVKVRELLTCLNLMQARCIIEVPDLFECYPFKEKFKEQGSYFFRGYLAGVLSQILGKAIKFDEVKCIAKGDLRCRFEVK